MLVALILLIAIGFIALERWWPANDLPRVRAWYPRVVLINVVQGPIVVIAGLTWDKWLRGTSLFHLRDHLGVVPQALVAYLVSTFVYYWWHRCHQLHHSPQRIEVLTSFYKHPVEIALNSFLSAAIVYAMLGVSIEAAAGYTLLTAVAEFFYH